PKDSSSVDTYGTVNFADARKNEPCPFLLGAQPVFGIHGHAALKQSGGAGSALTLTATIGNRNTHRFRKFQEGHVGKQFKLKSRAQEFNKRNRRVSGGIRGRQRSFPTKTFLLDAIGGDALFLKQFGCILH